jgi:hypothetical protein
MHGEPDRFRVDLAANGDTGLQATRVNVFTLVFGESTPDAVGLTDSQRMLGALDFYWTSATHGFRGGIPVDPGGTALSFGVEEHVGVFATA